MYSYNYSSIQNGTLTSTYNVCCRWCTVQDGDCPTSGTDADAVGVTLTVPTVGLWRAVGNLLTAQSLSTEGAVRVHLW